MADSLSFFSPQTPVFRASVPGLLDILGGFADYSGSLVLQMPIHQKTTVSVASRTDFLFRIQSQVPGQLPLQFAADYRDMLVNGVGVEYTFARDMLRQLPGGDWASYIMGCFLVLQKERGISVTGADILIESEVPVGKGLAASAALEVATLKALTALYQLSFSGSELPQLAQKVNHHIIHASTELSTLRAAYLAEPGSLLPVGCQADQILPPIPMPEGIRFVGIDSGIAPVLSAYLDVRTASFMAYSVIARECKATEAQLVAARDTGDKSALPYNGYLANISPAQFEEKFSGKMVYKMSGRYFTDFFPVHLDLLTQVEKDTFYSLLNCARHAVYENFRVHQYLLLLQYFSRIQDTVQRSRCLHQLGELMYQSHASYTACGLGHERTEELVQMVRENQGKGVYGARVTRKGSGGIVCILCEGDEGLKTARHIHQAFQEKNRLEVAFYD